MNSQSRLRTAILAACGASIAVIIPLGYYDGVVAAKAKTNRHLIMLSAVLAEEFEAEAGDLKKIADGKDAKWMVSWKEASHQHTDLIDVLVKALDYSSLELMLDVSSPDSADVKLVPSIPELTRQLKSLQGKSEASDDEVRAVMHNLADSMTQTAAALRGRFATTSVDRSFLYRIDTSPIALSRTTALDLLKQLEAASAQLSQMVQDVDIDSDSLVDVAVQKSVECCRISRGAYVHLYSIAESSRRYDEMFQRFIAAETRAKTATDQLVDRIGKREIPFDRVAVVNLKKYADSMKRRLKNLPLSFPSEAVDPRHI